MNRPKIFICGPVFFGDKNDNLDNGIDAQIELIRRGFAPLNPSLTLFLEKPYLSRVRRMEWVEVGMAWIEACDAVLRLPGDSIGVEQKCAYAEEVGKPIFLTIDMLERFFRG